jgi:hypothetical protein
MDDFSDEDIESGVSLVMSLGVADREYATKGVLAYLRAPWEPIGGPLPSSPEEIAEQAARRIALSSPSAVESIVLDAIWQGIESERVRAATERVVFAPDDRTPEQKEFSRVLDLHALGRASDGELTEAANKAGIR